MHIQKRNAESKEDDADIEKVSMKFLIRAMYPVCIYLTPIEKCWNEWKEDEPEDYKSMFSYLRYKGIISCKYHLSKCDEDHEDKKIHLLSLKRDAIPHYHTEVHEYMREIQWEYEKEEWEWEHEMSV